MLPRLSLAYIALPAVVFLAGWTRSVVAVPVGLALLAGLGVGAARTAGRSAASSRPVHRVLAVGLVVILALLCGAGAVGHQRIDWYKHNAVLHDLSTRPWPVVYDDVAGIRHGVLSYGLGYYLPAAAVGRAAGLDAAQLALLLWTAVGLGLTAAWLGRLTGRIGWIAFVAWLGVNGMDALGMLVLGVHPEDIMQWWAGFAQYSSNPSLLFWTPQHGLAGWLGAALVIHARDARWPTAATGCLIAAVVLWSPFAALGLVPLAAASVVFRRLRPGDVAVAAACAVPFAVVVTAYLLGGERVGVPTGWVWQALGPVRGVAMWLLFVAVEVGVPLAVLAWIVLKSAGRHWRWWWGENRVWLAPVAVTLMLLPAAYLGMYNDLVMRTSIPALFVLAVMVLRLRWTRGFVAELPVASRVLMLGLGIGALQPIADVAAQVAWTAGRGAATVPPVRLSLLELPDYIAGQYVMGTDGIYGRWIAPHDVHRP